MTEEYRHWRVVQSVELGVPAAEVWAIVGGFYNIHLWHPDIAMSEVPLDQTDISAVRRVLTFPGQPTTTEELILMDNEDFHYQYQWHAGQWGECVQQYRAALRVFDLHVEARSIVQWSSTFCYTKDALSEFYWNGFRELQKRFPLS